MLTGIEHIFCINLDRRPDRWYVISNAIKRAGLTVERVSAIDCNLHNISGEKACFLSHKKVLEKAVEMNLNTFLVLEDDAVFCRNFVETFNTTIKLLPRDWELFYLGGNLACAKEKNIGATLVKDNLYSHKYIRGSQAVVFNLESCKKILENLIEDVDIDLNYKDICKNESYISHPPICWQQPGFSDIVNEFFDYGKNPGFEILVK